MFEVAQTSKKKLWEFKPIVQAMYVQMHKLDFVLERKWQNILSNKPSKLDVSAAQEFVVRYSILV
jgi:hypothetical protein